jgi:hypothetical protein
MRETQAKHHLGGDVSSDVPARVRMSIDCLCDLAEA